MNTTTLAPPNVAIEQAPAAPAPAPASRRRDYASLRIVPARYPARTIGTIISLILIGAALNSVLGNPRWGWPVFAEWFFAEPVLVGLGRTLILTALGATLGFTLGTGLALARVSRSPLLRALAWTFVWIFRSIPLIVLLLILNNLGYLYETVWLGVPFTNITWAEWSTTQLVTPFLAAVIGLTLNQAAYSSEIIRGGILSVDQGQHEAAAALGLPRRRQAFRIVLPQAMRSILPSAFNDIIGLAKGTSNAYILALPELFYTIQIIYRRNLEVIPLLMVATVWYLSFSRCFPSFRRKWNVTMHAAPCASCPPPCWGGLGPGCALQQCPRQTQPRPSPTSLQRAPLHGRTPIPVVAMSTCRPSPKATTAFACSTTCRCMSLRAA